MSGHVWLTNNFTPNLKKKTSFGFQNFVDFTLVVKGLWTWKFIQTFVISVLAVNKSVGFYNF